MTHYFWYGLNDLRHIIKIAGLLQVIKMGTIITRDFQLLFEWTIFTNLVNNGLIYGKKKTYIWSKISETNLTLIYLTIVTIQIF